MRFVGGDGKLGFTEKVKILYKKATCCIFQQQSPSEERIMDDPLHFGAKMGSDLGWTKTCLKRCIEGSDASNSVSDLVFHLSDVSAIVKIITCLGGSLILTQWEC